MRGRAAVALLACVLSAGCGALVQETWSKPGATGQALTRDVADCERQARVDPTHGQEQGAYGFSVRALQTIDEMIGMANNIRGR